IHDNEYVFGYDQLYYTTVQKRLNELGTNPQLVVDGKWGDKSKAACIAFQKSKGLIADAVPGTKTLAALGITSTISSSMDHTIDAAAYSIAKKAGAQTGMTEQEIQYVVSVAKGEGGYGNSWGHPSAKTLQESKTFGITGYEGVGSNNWGAIQGTGSAGTFPHVDHDSKGKAYLGHYKKYKTSEEGFLDMAHTILGGGPIRKAVGAAEIQQAIAQGNLHDAVYAQHANRYFELNPEDYLSTVVDNYNKLMDNTGWPKLLDQYGITPARVTLGSGILLGLALLILLIF